MSTVCPLYPRIVVRNLVQVSTNTPKLRQPSGLNDLDLYSSMDSKVSQLIYLHLGTDIRSPFQEATQINAIPSSMRLRVSRTYMCVLDDQPHHRSSTPGISFKCRTQNSSTHFINLEVVPEQIFLVSLCSLGFPRPHTGLAFMLVFTIFVLYPRWVCP